MGSIDLSKAECSTEGLGDVAATAAFCMSPQFINKDGGYNISEGDRKDVGNDVGNVVGVTGVATEAAAAACCRANAARSVGCCEG